MGGFELHKWKANNLSLLNFPKLDCAAINASNSYFDVLGIQWSVEGDFLSLNFKLNDLIEKITKRDVLSCITKFFDPLGWFAPIIITAKIFMQKLCLAKLNWDEPLPQELKNEFLNWYSDVPVLRNIKIARWLNFIPGARYELHGFADASKFAYVACTYLNVIHNGKSTIHLVQAKSKVAHIKPLQTIPCLELSAGFLLSKLVVKVLRALNLNKVEVFLFTDSMDVLHWLKDHPSKWPMFVAHRCSKIHAYLPDAYWNHVRTHDNPADCVSRGILPTQLESFSLWRGGGSMINKVNNSKDSFQSKSINLVSFNLNVGVVKENKK